MAEDRDHKCKTAVAGLMTKSSVASFKSKVSNAIKSLKSLSNGSFNTDDQVMDELNDVLNELNFENNNNEEAQCCVSMEEHSSAFMDKSSQLHES